MRIQVPYIFVIVVLGLITAPLCSAEQWFRDYQGYVKQQALKYNVPGYALVYYQKGSSPQIATFGFTHKGGARINKKTVFRLASVSKTFTALLMSKWIDGYDLSWQTPVSQLLKDPKWQQSRFRTLTLEDIIGQSSGFMPNAYDNLIEADYSLQRVLTDLAELELLCQPGECYTYQNALFGALMEYFYQKNTSYHRQMQDLVFSPLGMETASVGKAGLIHSDSWARPHIALSQTKWRQGEVENNYYRFAPAAGVNASINDMTRYLQALLGEMPQVLSTDNIQLVTTPRISTSRERYRRGWRQYLKDAHYGLGWRIYDFQGHTINYHGGWVKGYRADVAFCPEKGVGFAILMNAESNMINTATAEFWHRYFENE